MPNVSNKQGMKTSDLKYFLWIDWEHTARSKYLKKIYPKAKKWAKIKNSSDFDPELFK